MRKFALLLLIAAASVLAGCTKMIYNHEAVMQAYKTKQDVIRTFGLPVQQKDGKDLTEWMYDFTNISTKFASRKDTPSYVSRNTSTQKVSEFTNYKRYVKFTLDQQGNVLKWESQGVDLAKRKIKPIATGAVVLAGAVVIAVIYVLEKIKEGL